MAENRLLKLSIEHPELSAYVDRIKSKREFLKILQRYLSEYTEEDFDKDLYDLKTLRTEDISSVAGGLMTFNQEISNEFFKNINNQIKKILRICS